MFKLQLKKIGCMYSYSVVGVQFELMHKVCYRSLSFTFRSLHLTHVLGLEVILPGRWYKLEADICWNNTLATWCEEPNSLEDLTGKREQKAIEMKSWSGIIMDMSLKLRRKNGEAGEAQSSQAQLSDEHNHKTGLSTLLSSHLFYLLQESDGDTVHRSGGSLKWNKRDVVVLPPASFPEVLQYAYLNFIGKKKTHWKIEGWSHKQGQQQEARGKVAAWGSSVLETTCAFTIIWRKPPICNPHCKFLIG